VFLRVLPAQLLITQSEVEGRGAWERGGRERKRENRREEEFVIEFEGITCKVNSSCAVFRV
jgi:hypothetical protein